MSRARHPQLSSNGQIRVEAYLDSGDKAVNKRLFDELYGSAEEIARKTCVDLTGERLDDRRASRVGACRSMDLDDAADTADAVAWASTTVINLHRASRRCLHVPDHAGLSRTVPGHPASFPRAF